MAESLNVYFLIVRRGPIWTAAGVWWPASTRVRRTTAAARLRLPAAVLSACQHQGRKQILLGWATRLWGLAQLAATRILPVLALHSTSQTVQCSAWLLAHTYPVASTPQCAVRMSWGSSA
jgi:hypothetical protein